MRVSLVQLALGSCNLVPTSSTLQVAQASAWSDLGGGVWEDDAACGEGSTRALGSHVGTGSNPITGGRRLESEAHSS